MAGSVVAAAVVLPMTAANDKLKVESVKYKAIRSAGIRDSKLLSPEKREEVSAIIKDNCLAWGIGTADEKIIDKINIHNATLLAMRRAVEGLFYDVAQARGLPQMEKQAEGLHYKGKAFLYIDGKFTIPNFDIYQEAVIDGDNKILSIAAASIIAKVYRDDLMRKFHQQYPLYNFRQHKGYGTLYHRTMILQNGLSPIHRRSFCENLSV